MLTARRGRSGHFLGQMKRSLSSTQSASSSWSNNIGNIKDMSFQIIGMSVLIEDAVIIEIKGR